MSDAPAHAAVSAAGSQPTTTDDGLTVDAASKTSSANGLDDSKRCEEEEATLSPSENNAALHNTAAPSHEDTPASSHEDTPAPSHVDTPVPSREDIPAPSHGDTPAPLHEDIPVPLHEDTPAPLHEDTPAPSHEDALAAPHDAAVLETAAASEERASEEATTSTEASAGASTATAPPPLCSKTSEGDDEGAASAAPAGGSSPQCLSKIAEIATSTPIGGHSLTSEADAGEPSATAAVGGRSSIHEAVADECFPAAEQEMCNLLDPSTSSHATGAGPSSSSISAVAEPHLVNIASKDIGGTAGPQEASAAQPTTAAVATVVEVTTKEGESASAKGPAGGETDLPVAETCASATSAAAAAETNTTVMSTTAVSSTGDTKDGGDRSTTEKETEAMARRLATMGPRMEAFCNEKTAAAASSVVEEEENAYSNSSRSTVEEAAATTLLTPPVKIEERPTDSFFSSSASSSSSSSSAVPCSPPVLSSSLPSSPTGTRDLTWGSEAVGNIPTAVSHFMRREEAACAAGVHEGVHHHLSAAMGVIPVDTIGSQSKGVSGSAGAALHLDQETAELFAGITSETSVEKLQQRLAAAEFWYEKLQGDLHEWIGAAVEWRGRVEEGARQQRQQQEALEVLRLEKAAVERQLETEKASYRRSRDELLEEKVLLQQRVRDLQHQLQAAEAAAHADACRSSMSSDSDSNEKRKRRAEMSSDTKNATSHHKGSESVSLENKKISYKSQQREIEALRATETQLRKERDELVGNLYHERLKRQEIQEQLAEKDSICQTNHVLELAKLKHELDDSENERQVLQRELISIKIKYAETAYEELGARQQAMQQGLQRIQTLQKLQSLQPVPVGGSGELEGGGNRTPRGDHTEIGKDIRDPRQHFANSRGGAGKFSASRLQGISSSRVEHEGSPGAHQAPDATVRDVRCMRGSSSGKVGSSHLPTQAHGQPPLSARLYAALRTPRGSPSTYSQQNGNTGSTQQGSGTGGSHGSGFGGFCHLLTRTMFLGGGDGKDRDKGGGLKDNPLLLATRRSSSVEIKGETGALENEGETAALRGAASDEDDRFTKKKIYAEEGGEGGHASRTAYFRSHRASSDSTGRLLGARTSCGGSSIGIVCNSNSPRHGSNTGQTHASTGGKWSPLWSRISYEEIRHSSAEADTGAATKTTTATTAASPLATLSCETSPSIVAPIASRASVNLDSSAITLCSSAAGSFDAGAPAATDNTEHAILSGSVDLPLSVTAAADALEAHGAFKRNFIDKGGGTGHCNEGCDDFLGSVSSTSCMSKGPRVISSPRVPPLRLGELERRLQQGGPGPAAQYMSQREAVAATAAAAAAALCSSRDAVVDAATLANAVSHSARADPSKHHAADTGAVQEETFGPASATTKKHDTDKELPFSRHYEDRNKEDQMQQEQKRGGNRELYEAADVEQHQKKKLYDREVNGDTVKSEDVSHPSTSNSSSRDMSKAASRSSSSHSSRLRLDSGEADGDTLSDMIVHTVSTDSTGNPRSRSKWQKMTGTTKRWVKRLNTHFVGGGRHSSEEDHHSAAVDDHTTTGASPVVLATTEIPQRKKNST